MATANGSSSGIWDPAVLVEVSMGVTLPTTPIWLPTT
jgi:hypothetical protein